MDLAKHIDANRSHALSTLKELLKIKSEAEDPVTTASGEVYPFGSGVQDAFAYMLSKGEELGFSVRNVDNYGGHIDFGEGEETVGILGHLDVVPAGSGWDNEPYGAEETDGYIIGRGTTDDKGPLVAAFYAMKALKDAGYEPHRKIRLILGLDEETGWKGIEYYFDKVEAPTFGITPDADFPVINGEKGIMFFELARKLSKGSSKGLQLSRLSGGEAPNMVPGSARAVIRSDVKNAYEKIKEKIAAFREAEGYTVKTKGVGKSLEITCEGVACHGAVPEKGLNAISILMKLLGELNFANEEVNEFIDFYNKHIGFNLDGSRIGIGFSDEKSGRLSLNNGIISYDRDSISINVNVRYPVSCDAEKVYEGMTPVLDSYGIGVVKMIDLEPLYFNPEGKLIETLMEVYREETGDTVNGPLVIGGGTYARACPNIVAFGGLFPGDPDIMHQKNEKLSIERFNQMIDIYAKALYRLTQEEFSI